VTDPAVPAEPEPAAAPDPTAIIKSRSYVVLLLLGAVIGVPVAAVAYFFLDAVAKQRKPAGLSSAITQEKDERA